MKKSLILLFILSVLLGCGDVTKKTYDNSRNTESNTGGKSTIKELISQQKPNFKMLNASSSEYLNKEFLLYGYAELVSYYNYGYMDAKKTHYSIELSDNNFDRVYIYFDKKSNNKLFDFLGGKEKVPMKIKVIMKSNRFDDSQTAAFFEGLSWDIEDSQNAEYKSESKTGTKTKELISQQKPNFKMLNASSSEYLNKEFLLYGYAELVSYYNYGYMDAKKTHYSIELSDNNFDRVYIYFDKKSNNKLFDFLGGKEKAPMKIKVIMKSNRFDDSQTAAFFEGLSWDIIEQ